MVELGNNLYFHIVPSDLYLSGKLSFANILYSSPEIST